MEVAVIPEKGVPVAFLPFQRNPLDKSRAIPVADFLSDFQGLICKPDFTCDPLEVIRKCGLGAYDFSKFLASEKSFVPFHGACESSPQMSLSRGYNSYAEERRAAGSKLISECNRKARRLEREVGLLTFVAHSSDPKLLQRTIAMKSDQYRRTGARDVFAIDWVRLLIERIYGTQTDNFSGCCLYSMRTIG